MGKYFDDYEREADYQNWLYYRESSHEERESKSHYICSDKNEAGSESRLVIQKVECPVVDVFSNYPEHKALVEAAEQKYFNSKDNSHAKALDDDSD